MNRQCKITIKLINKTLTVKRGVILKAALEKAGLGDLIDFPCGGRGICGKCKVLIDKLPTISSAEKKFLTDKEIKVGVRLACLVKITRDIEISIPAQAKIQKKKIIATGKKAFYKNISCGLAIDIGTTVVEAALVDLKTGKEIASAKQRNKQRRHGEDVISRISYSLEKKENLAELQQLAISNINSLINILGAETGIDKNSINYAVIAGNTVMEHFLLGKDTKPLASLPFKPAFRGGARIGAKQLGIKINSQADIYVIPNLAGFIGGDITAGIIKSGLYKKAQGYYMLIDVGTNGEVVIGNNNHIYCASAAAGPALEGMGISCGMLAQEGAICEVSAKKNSDLNLKIINNIEPTGICGSGIIDLMAILIRNKTIDSTGKMIKPPYLVYKGARHDIIFTQKDVRQVQLAKSAIFTAINLLMQEAGINKEKIKKIYIAGEFGKNIKINNAIKIGLIPKFSLSEIKYMGNMSLQGAESILLNEGLIQIAESLASKCKHIELANKREFQDMFAENLLF